MKHYLSIRTALSGFLGLACLSLVWGCEQKMDDEPIGSKEQSVNEPPTTEDVAEKPGRFIGRTLTLIGEVEDIESPMAFQLEGNKELFDDELLVLTKSPVTFGRQALKEDDEVIVTGTVRNLVVSEIERELNWDLSTDLETKWSSKNVLVASSVSKVDEFARWEEKNEPEGVHVGLLSIYLAPDPKALIGEPISVDMAQVESVTGNGVWLGAAHRFQTLVLPKDGDELPKLEPGDWVKVHGTLREMPSQDETLRRLNTPEASEHLKRQLEEEPYFIEASSMKKMKPQGADMDEKQGAKERPKSDGDRPETGKMDKPGRRTTPASVGAPTGQRAAPMPKPRPQTNPDTRDNPNAPSNPNTDGHRGTPGMQPGMP